MLHQTGSGVLGPVFRAFDLKHDRVVAIKAFTLDLFADRVPGLADALRRLAATSAPHPSVVLPHEAAIEGTTPFMVMAHQPGETLDLLMRRLAPMPPEFALPLLRAIATAVDAAALAGLDHGALHPRDVFVTPDGTVSITGFGTVRALEAAGVDAPVRRPYSAPERVAAEWDWRADLYSFGVIAHELLTRRRPLGPGEQDGEFTPDLSPERRVQLRRVLARAIAECPADRYASAAEFVDALAVAGLGALLDTRTPEVFEESPRHEPHAPSQIPVLGPEPGGLRPDSEAWSRTPDARRLTPDAVPLTSRRSIGRRVAAVAGLAAFGLLGALAGHVAVRLVRQSPATNAASLDPGAVEQTEVVLSEPAATEVVDVPSGAAPEVETVAVAAPAGRLLIRSEPAGALVTIDGRRSGQTPAVVNALPFGAHVVQVARSGFAPRVAHITLAADTPEQRLSFALRPGLSVGAQPGGGIDVASRPRGARVLVDGRFVGHAPLRVPQLKPGKYTVTLELAGYQSYTGRVGVSAGTLSTFKPTLRSTNR